MIKKLFDEYATGTYTLRQIVNQAEKWGLCTKTGQPVGKSVIDRLLKNPFYYGEMLFKDEIVPADRVMDLVSDGTFTREEY